MADKPYWFPKLVDSEYCDRLRKDYPDDAHMSDDELRCEYGCESKYGTGTLKP